MCAIVLSAVISIIPLIVLFSGMAMTPVLIAVVLLIACATPRASYKKPRECLAEYRALAGLLLAMLLWPVVTTLWSITPERSIGSALQILSSCAMGLFAFTYIRAIRPPSVRMLGYYAGAMLLASVIILLEKLPTGGLITQLYTGDAYDRFMLKNINRGLCALVVMMWPLMAGLFLAGQRRFAWGVLLVLFLAVLSMHSLSAKAGFVAAILTFFALQRFPAWTSRGIMVVLPLFLLSFPLLFMALEHTLFAEPLVRAHLPESAIHRLNIWHELLTQVGERPLLGWGMDTSRAMPLSEHALTVLGLKAPPLHPHSPSLQIVLELGIVGLVLFAAGLGAILWKWVKCARLEGDARAISGAMIVAYFVTGVSSFGIWQSWWVATLWIAALTLRYLLRVAPAPAA